MFFFAIIAILSLLSNNKKTEKTTELEKLRADVAELKENLAEERFFAAIKKVRYLYFRKDETSRIVRKDYEARFRTLWAKKTLSSSAWTYSDVHYETTCAIMEIGHGTNALVFNIRYVKAKNREVTIKDSDFVIRDVAHLAFSQYPDAICNLIQCCPEQVAPQPPPNKATNPDEVDRSYQLLWIDSETERKRSPALIESKKFQLIRENRPVDITMIDEAAGILFFYGKPLARNEMSFEEMEARFDELVSEWDLDDDDVLPGVTPEDAVCDETICDIRERLGYSCAIACGVGAYKLTGKRLFTRNMTIDLTKLLPEEGMSLLNLQNINVLKYAELREALKIIKVTELQDNFPDFSQKDREYLSKIIPAMCGLL